MAGAGRGLDPVRDVPDRDRELFPARDHALDAARTASRTGIANPRRRNRYRAHAEGSARRRAMDDLPSRRQNDDDAHIHACAAQSRSKGAAQTAQARTAPRSRDGHAIDGARHARGRAFLPLPLPAPASPSLGPLAGGTVRDVHAGRDPVGRDHAQAHLRRLLHAALGQRATKLARRAQCVSSAGAALSRDDHLHRADHARGDVHALAHRRELRVAARIQRRGLRHGGRAGAVGRARTDDPDIAPRRRCDRRMVGRTARADRRAESQ